MQNDVQRPVEEPLTLGDKFMFWLFIAGLIFCAGLGVWALFFKN
jgi:hypothetical protein